jgi:hypothetical protein
MCFLSCIQKQLNQNEVTQLETNQVLHIESLDHYWGGDTIRDINQVDSGDKHPNSRTRARGYDQYVLLSEYVAKLNRLRPNNQDQLGLFNHNHVEAQPNERTSLLYDLSPYNHDHDIHHHIGWEVNPYWPWRNHDPHYICESGSYNENFSSNWEQNYWNDWIPSHPKCLYGNLSQDDDKVAENDYFSNNWVGEDGPTMYDETLSSQQVESGYALYGEAWVDHRSPYVQESVFTSPQSDSSYWYDEGKVYTGYTLSTDGMTVDEFTYEDHVKGHPRKRYRKWKDHSSSRKKGVVRNMPWDEISWFEEYCRRQRGQVQQYVDLSCDYTQWGQYQPAYLICPSPHDVRAGSSSSCYSITKDLSDKSSYYMVQGENPVHHQDDSDRTSSICTITPNEVSNIIQATSKWCEENDTKKGEGYASVLNTSVDKRKLYKFSLDSASTEHIMSMEAACLLFNQSPSQLKLLGVSGTPTSADVEGMLILTVLHDGKEYKIDLGKSYSVNGCPQNILSISKLLDQSAVVHLERGNSYIVLNTSDNPTKIPIVEVDGMFKLEAGKFNDFHVSPDGESILSKCKASLDKQSHNIINDSSQLSHSVSGECYAVSGNMDLWHRRVRHHNPKSLAHIHEKGNVLGFKLKNPPKGEAKCRCETCTLAKLQRIPTPKSRPFASQCDHIGHTVSVDIKSLGVETHKGYKYVICFVDHYSHLSMAYYMRKKSETSAMLTQYIKDMKRLGNVTIKNIQSDRGSEFYEQEGISTSNLGRELHSFGKICESNGIHHIKIPVGEKEKLAEQWNKEHFRCANTMLLEARLSPMFWADAVEYSSYQYNRMPNPLNKDGLSPWQLLTGEIPRWDKWKVFGCDTYEHIPNNKYDKVPGIPRGRKCIFIGFKSGHRGHLLFDPVTRITHTASNCYFNEDFTDRQNALFFYDRRRSLLQKNKVQPIQMNDNDESVENINARNVFLDADKTTLLELQKRENKSNNGQTSSSSSSSNSSPIDQIDIIELESHDTNEANDSMIRPVRLLPVDRVTKLTEEDKRFIRAMEISDSPCVFQKRNPKGKKSISGKRYELYKLANTLREAQELGATPQDIRWDYARGWITFPNNESKVSAHVCNATNMDERNSSSFGLHNRKRPCFNSVLETVYEPDVILDMIEDRQEMAKFAEQMSHKVLLSQPHDSKVEIDFSLDPEPQDYRHAMWSSESQEWKESMEDEIASMTRFGVFNRVHRSVAKGRQILGCKWVYKRKIGPDGQVNRYRSRLVCQGFRQKAYDSFQPDETFSPVVHKDTLRLFLSASAAQNMIIYQADVKAAFLQAPLKEKIYMKCPPGFETYDENGGEEVLELNSAVYGLKQSNACFWNAVHSHLIENGFIPTLGDPCLFKKIYENGKTVFVCCYVDDLTYSAPDLETATIFLNMMRDRFVIEDKEGQPIEWLLGMSIKQNMDKGTVHMSMEVMITKLAHAILTPEELVKSKRILSPMATTPLMKQATREVSKGEFDYLSVVGSLLHIANCVRCDISYAVGALARHSLTVGKAHVKAAKRVVMYLYNTLSLGITYFKDTEKVNTPLIYEHAVHPLNDGTNILRTFVDSDYAADQTRRSTMGIVTMMNGGPISWSSVLGKTVATSTCEAEVNAAVVAVKESIHIKQLLLDLDLTTEDAPLQVAEDNAACIAQAESGLRHVRNAKHYEVKLRFLQQHSAERSIEFVYCPTDDQLADMFTKPLEVDKFVTFRDQIMKNP